MSRDTIATINISALRHNLSKIQQLAKNQIVLAMIKSNGYGHGLVRVAKYLNENSAAVVFGVACLGEALRLRDAGIKNAIMVTEGFLDAAEIISMVEHNIIAVIHQRQQIAQLEKTKISQPLSVWLKIDTGMHRLGFSLSTARIAYECLQHLKQVKKPIGLMTHLADADNADQTFTLQQIDAFNKITADLPGPKSIVNSAGIISYPQAHADWVRPGIMLYGVSPFADKSGEAHGLKPVMTLRAKVIALHECQVGDHIGYG